MASKNDQHHVLYDSDNSRWEIKRSGSTRVSAYADTKKEAVDIARVISDNQNTELFVHNMDGKIGYKDSHGSDKFPPRG